MSERPKDGARKKDQAGSTWIACCGIWFSEDAWTPPQADVEHDVTEAARTHRVITEGTRNCPECCRSFYRNDPDAVALARVIALADERIDGSIEAAYAQRLHDTIEGEWLRFGPHEIGPRRTESMPLSTYIDEPVEVAFLALPLAIASMVRVIDVNIGRRSLVDGPIPGECFSVRVPIDAKRPIDRGGSLARRGVYTPTIGARVVIENTTNHPIEVIGALFAPRPPKLTVVGAGSGSIPFDFDPNASGRSG